MAIVTIPVETVISEKNGLVDPAFEALNNSDTFEIENEGTTLLWLKAGATSHDVIIATPNKVDNDLDIDQVTITLAIDEEIVYDTQAAGLYGNPITVTATGTVTSELMAFRRGTL